ncbi:MAG TPA: VOC family protein [Thermoleophilaceae bacterium]|jgi:catechol 2,3-dioxygenase|nr:VOC family protein [Thermoleophilaceae bacterium]
MAAERLPSATRVASVTLRSGDPGPAVGFYGGVLGLRELPGGNGELLLGAGGQRPLLRLVRTSPGTPAPSRATGLFHTALRYSARAELADALRRLLAAGLRLSGASDHGVSEALYLGDPDGNGVELYWDRPHDRWPRPAPGERVGMFTRPLDLERLLAVPPPERADPDPAVDIGHVHLKVSKLERSVTFYRDVLGLELMQRFGSEAAFLAAGDYHHHVGLNVWYSGGSGPPPPGSAGLAGFALELPRPDEVERAAVRLQGAGIPIERHNGEIRAHDPDGIGLGLVAARAR